MIRINSQDHSLHLLIPQASIRLELKDGGGGFNPKKPKKPKTTLKSHFGYWVFWVFWVLLDFFKDIFKKSYKSLLAHCNITLVDFERYFSPFKICLG